MSKKELPSASNDDPYQLPKEELVEIIKALQAEIARLKEILNTLDTGETDLIRKPGGQLLS